MSDNPKLPYRYNLRLQKGQVVREIGILTGILNEPFRRLTDAQKIGYQTRIKMWECVLESLDELSRKRQECDDFRHRIKELEKELENDRSSLIETAN